MPGKGNYKIRDGSYEYYISEPVVNDDAKGIGPFVYAYSEWLQLQRPIKTVILIIFVSANKPFGLLRRVRYNEMVGNFLQ